MTNSLATLRSTRFPGLNNRIFFFDVTYYSPEWFLLFLEQMRVVATTVMETRMTMRIPPPAAAPA